MRVASRQDTCDIFGYAIRPIDEGLDCSRLCSDLLKDFAPFHFQK